MWKHCALGAVLLLAAGERATRADAAPQPAVRPDADGRKQAPPQDGATPRAEVPGGARRPVDPPPPPNGARPGPGDLADIRNKKADPAHDKAGGPPDAKQARRDPAELRRDLRQDLREVRADRRELTGERTDKRDAQEARRVRREALRDPRTRR